MQYGIYTNQFGCTFPSFLATHQNVGQEMSVTSLNAKNFIDERVVQETQREDKKENFTLERVAGLAELLAEKVEKAIIETEKFNSQTHMIAINARIEASRAGQLGKAFAVVAEQMNELSIKIGDVNKKMRRESKDAITELGNLIKTQATNVRGTRLSDLALTNIDLIDRNLYERTADVRWWATDIDVVDAMTARTKEGYTTVSNRFSAILNAYTVYYDLVLCDTDGNVVANGKPQKHNLVGSNFRDTEWFNSALRTSNGKEFGFQSVHRCPLVNNQFALVYSCAVRENGNPHGNIIGILGTVFNWEGLAQKIMHDVALNDGEKANSRVCITENDGRVLADSDGKILVDTIEFSGRNELFDKKKDFSMTEYGRSKCCIAHALSQGYESYSTGWHSIIIQKLDSKY